MTYRFFTFLALTAILIASANTAHAGKWLNQFGRYFGYGYSDGYHASRNAEPSGESVLVGPGGAPHIAPSPAPVPAEPAAAPATGAIEPSPALMPKAPRLIQIPSRQMTPAPATTTESATTLRSRLQSRPSGPIWQRAKAKEAGPTEAVDDGLATPAIEGPGPITIDGPTLAPASQPAADGSIAPYPEAPPATRSPIAEPQDPPRGVPSASRRYFPPR